MALDGDCLRGRIEAIFPNMLKITQRLAMTLPLGAQPIFRTNKEIAVFYRWKYLKAFLERDKPAGRKHPRLEAECEVLRGMAFGVALPIAGVESVLTSLPDREQQIVKRAEQWLLKTKAQGLPPKRKKSN